MEKQRMEALINRAKTGDVIARETMIKHYKPYILNVVHHVLSRYVTWSDEETSLAMIAFNRAIDTFKHDQGKSFVNYAYLLIKRDLIDYLRKNKAAPRELLSSEEETHPYHDQKAVEQYQEAIQQSELTEEILEFKAVLASYQISLSELEASAPKHKRSRRRLIEMSEAFCQHTTLVQQLTTKQRLPATAFSKRSGFQKKTIEKHRKYLIALILLKINPQLQRLTTFVTLQTGGEQDDPSSPRGSR